MSLRTQIKELRPNMCYKNEMLLHWLHLHFENTAYQKYQVWGHTQPDCFILTTFILRNVRGTACSRAWDIRRTWGTSMAWSTTPGTTSGTTTRRCGTWRVAGYEGISCIVTSTVSPIYHWNFIVMVGTEKDTLEVENISVKENSSHTHSAIH